MTTAKDKNRGKALPVDWEAITAHWLQTGKDYAATASAFGIKKNTLVKRISRLGERGKPMTTSAALKQVEKARETLKEIAKEDDRKVIVSPVDAFQSQKDAFKSSMSTALHKTGEYIGTLPADAILSESRKVKDILDSGAKLYGFGEDGGKAQISVNVLGLSLDGFAPRPVIDL